MNDAGKKDLFESFLKYIPYLSAIAYLLGYIVFNAYLSTYGIYEFNLVNFQYLKAGLIFMIIITPIALIIWHEIKAPVGTLKEDKEDLIKTTLLVGTYFITVCYLLF